MDVAEDMVSEQHAWLANLVNFFAQFQGLEAACQARLLAPPLWPMDLGSKRRLCMVPTPRQPAGTALSSAVDGLPDECGCLPGQILGTCTGPFSLLDAVLAPLAKVGLPSGSRAVPTCSALQRHLTPDPKATPATPGLVPGWLTQRCAGRRWGS